MTVLQVGAAPIEPRWHGGWRIPGKADVFETRDAAFVAAGVSLAYSPAWLALADAWCSARDAATEDAKGVTPAAAPFAPTADLQVPAGGRAPEPDTTSTGDVGSGALQTLPTVQEVGR